jgi:hypothetical protein
MALIILTVTEHEFIFVQTFSSPLKLTITTALRLAIGAAHAATDNTRMNKIP